MRFSISKCLPQRHLGLVLGAIAWLASILALYNGLPGIGFIAAGIAIWACIGILADLGRSPERRLILVALVLILQSAVVAVVSAGNVAGLIEFEKKKSQEGPIPLKGTR